MCHACVIKKTTFMKKVNQTCVMLESYYAGSNDSYSSMINMESKEHSVHAYHKNNEPRISEISAHEISIWHTVKTNKAD